MNTRELLALASKRATAEFDRKTGHSKYVANNDIVKSIEKEKAAREKKLKALTPKERKLSEFLNENPFGCNQKKVHELVNILVGKDIPVEDHDDEDIEERGPMVRSHAIPQLAMLVAIVNPNNHDYGTEPALAHSLDADDRFDNMLKPNGRTGNVFPYNRWAFRIATDAEIDAFFKNIPADGLCHYIDDDTLDVLETVGGPLTSVKKKAVKKKKKATKKKARKKVAKKKVARRKR